MNDASNIRQRRISLGLMQKQLAYEAAVSACAVSHAERGHDRGHGSGYGNAASRKIDAALRRLEINRVAAAIVDEAWL